MTLTGKMSRLILATFIFVSLLPACVKTPPQSAAKTGNRQVVEAAQAQTVQAKLQSFQDKQAGLGYLSAFAQVSIERGKQRRLFDAVIQAAPPNRISIQVLNDLGQEIARVIADGHEVYFQDKESGRSQIFAQDGESLRKTLRLPIRIEDLVDRLLLRLPNSPVLQVEQEINATTPTYWVLRQDDSLRFDGEATRLGLYESKPAGKSWNYRVEYSDYKRIDGRDFPERIVWNFHKPSLKMNLKLQQIAFEPPSSRDVESSFDTKNR